jgi:hypothetical protein
MLTELSTRSQSQPRHPGQRNRRPFLLLSVLSLLLTPALHADVLWVADFDEGKTPIDIAATSIISDVFNASHEFRPHSVLEPARGNSGYSLKFNHVSGDSSVLVLDFGTQHGITSFHCRFGFGVQAVARNFRLH